VSNPGEADGAPIVGGLEMIENDIDFERYFSFSSFFLYFFFYYFRTRVYDCLFVFKREKKREGLKSVRCAF
jgi:hypothetical protein